MKVEGRRSKFEVASAYAVTALFAVAIAASVFRIPIQVSDSLEILELTDRAPSVPAAFREGLHASRTMLRPMRQTGTKILLDVAHAAGDRYNLVFRGFHAAAAALLVFLFAHVARPRDWSGVAAFCVSMLVLTGLHTFDGMLREAYPINHFLLIAIYCLAVFALAETRGGLATDAAACALFVVAALTLESGLVVLAVAVAAYLGGLRGISRTALIGMAALLVGYIVLRVPVLHMIGNAVGERPTGFGSQMLTAGELRSRFGATPALLYLYTIVCSALTVLLSQPVAGEWTALAPWDPHAPPLYLLNNIGTSMVATGVVAWYLARRRAPDGRRRWRDPGPLATFAVLGGSAVLSYAYAKSEIMSAAGVFYALLVSLASRELIEVLVVRTSAPTRVPVLAAVLVITTAWAWRAVGLQYRLQRGAFEARSEWVLRLPPYGTPSVPLSKAHLTTPLQEEALHRGRTNPYLLWPPYARLWGEN